MADSVTVGDTKKLILPDEYLPTIHDKIKETAVVANLATQTPKLYKNQDVIYMTQRPVTEYVGNGVDAGEGGAKHAMDWGYDTKALTKFKLQTTIRVTEEVEWADEDSSLNLFDKVLDELNASLGEGVDAGMIHAFNPFPKTTMEAAQKVALSYIGQDAVYTGDIVKDIDALPDKVIAAKFTPNGIALDTMYANSIRKLRYPNTGLKMYPDIPLSLDMGNFEGLRSVTSANVSGRSFAGLGDTGIQAIIGDWSQIEWGIIRDVALRRFDVGDPDNRGYDLSYKNEVAYRVEMVFAFGVVYDDAFAILRATSDDDGGDGGDDNNSGGGGDEGGDEVQTQSVKAAAKSAKA